VLKIEEESCITRWNRAAIIVLMNRNDASGRRNEVQIATFEVERLSKQPEFDQTFPKENFRRLSKLLS
jgi:hypothetical protein